MNWKLLAVCLLITLSGCTVVDQPGRENSVTFVGEIDASGNEFVMEGHLQQQGVGKEKLRNVSVCGYTEQKTLLFAEPVRPFEQRQEIDIQTDREPHYIVIYSDEFWGSDALWKFENGKIDSVEYLQRGQDDLYARIWAESPSELPIDTDRPLQNGCPA